MSESCSGEPHDHAMMGCEEVLVHIQTWIDQQLEDSVSGLVSSHLSRCPVCDREAQTFIRLKAALQRQRSACDEIVVQRLQMFGMRLCSGEIPPPAGTSD